MEEREGQTVACDLFGRVFSLLSERLREVKKSGENFNPLSEFFVPDENMTSKILEFFLKDEPYRTKFLELCGLNGDFFDPETQPFIRREYPTTGDRRIDLVLWQGRKAIGIENKSRWAVDQHRQVEDYIDELQETFSEDSWVVYLKDGAMPSKDSLSPEKCDRCRPLAFRTLLDEWINLDHDTKRTSFLKDLRAYLLGVDDVLQDKFKNEILATNENIVSAFFVLTNAASVGKKMAEVLMGSMKQHRPSDWELRPCSGTANIFDRYYGMSFVPPDWETLSVSIDLEFSNTFCQEMIFYVNPGKHKDKAQDIFEKIRYKLPKSYKININSNLIRQIDPGKYRNWNDLLIAEEFPETLAENIWKRVTEIRDELDGICFREIVAQICSVR